MASSSGAAPGFDLPSTTGTALPETIGRYRLLQKIAKGGMAEVFAARSYGAHGFEKTVALKRILPKFGRDPQFVRMMVDEAKISVLLNHQNIAQILELGEQDGDYFIVMEFVPGQSLSAVVKRLREDGGRLPTLESCFVVVELLQGLHAAHIQRDASGKPARIIHRDVSPQNTLLSFDGHVKVIDFGIARARDRLEATEVGTIKGKLRYLAPEMIDPGRFHPDGDFDHRVDVFAAGIVLWELVSGRTLFPGDDEMKVYDDITDGVTPDLHKEGLCDAALMRILHKALERDLSRRYATAEDFADDLRAYVYRTDPAFTHKRVAATLERLFPDEKAAMLAVERGQLAPPDPRPPPAPGAGATSSPRRAGRLSPEALPSPAITHGVDTRTMRSDKGEPSGVEGAGRADRPDDRVEGARPGPLGRELTVMTIVSRDSVLGSVVGSEFAENSAGDGVFAAAEDATLTVAADELLRARGGGAARSSSTVVADPRGALGAAPGALAADDSAPTRPRAESLLAPSPSAPSPPATGGGRVIVLSAAAGVALAVVIVGLIEVFGGSSSSPPPPVALAPPAPPPSTTVASSPPPSPPSSPPPSPPPVAVLVPVQLRVSPPGAQVTLDGRPATPTSTVQPDVPVVVEVTAPGHAPVRREARPEAGAPFLIDVTLPPLAPPPEPPKTPKDPPTEPAKEPQRPPPRPAGPAARGKGTLQLRATPYWGQVVVDGKALDEQTPVSVQLTSGLHDVVVSHPPRGLVKRFKVSIAPGETVTRTVTFD